MARVVELSAAIAAAERQFIVAGDIDMDQLARTLVISRATLYRVVGSRERLLGDVLWQRGRRGMDRAQRHAQGTGAERVIDIARRFNLGVVADKALDGFLHADPSTAFRVLFMPEGAVHRRFVELWRNILAERIAAGDLRVAMDVESLAYLFVRLGESLLYADLLAGRSPDVELAAVVQRAVLFTEAETASQVEATRQEQPRN